MTRRATIHSDPGDNINPSATPKEAMKLEFARRLQAAYKAKGWNQSLLAKEATKHMPDGQKFGRDTISTYVNMKSIPGPVSLNALCKALGMRPDELLPTVMSVPGKEFPSPLTMRDMNDGTVYLSIQQRVPWEKAMKVLRVIRGDDETDGSGR